MDPCSEPPVSQFFAEEFSFPVLPNNMPRTQPLPLKENDRFIPNRAATSNCTNMFLLANKPKKTVKEQEFNPYSKMIAEELLDHFQHQEKHRIINFKQPAIHHSEKTTKCKKSINVAKAPFKILDAPDLRNDYYLNLLNWSANNVISILLDKTYYLYTPDAIHSLDISTGPYFCSVTSLGLSSQVASGNSDGLIRVYDAERCKPLRDIQAHSSRVTSLLYQDGILVSGSKDTNVNGFDVRARNSLTYRLQGHMGEVCGLTGEAGQLATGGNDNRLILWDTRKSMMKHVISAHNAAVKALSFCPWQRNLLASGGGSNDMKIKFWNVDSGQQVNQIATDSQVCSLVWNRYDKNILSSHGFSKNQLCIWNYPTMEKVVQLQRHQDRVLHLAMSPDGSTVCSASADETLCLWKVFDVPEQRREKSTIQSILDLGLR